MQMPRQCYLFSYLLFCKMTSFYKMTAVRLIKIPRFHWNVQRNLANHSLDKQDFQKPQRTSSSWRVYWRAAVRCAAKTVTMQCCWFLGGVPNSNFFWIAHLLFENAGSEKRAMPARAEKILYQNILLVSSEKSMTI